MRKFAKKQKRYKWGTYFRVVAIMAAFAILGWALLKPSSAATYATSTQAESGAIAGNAAAITEINASGGSAVKFGLASGQPTAPTNLVTWTGGNSIALRWDSGSAAGAATVKQYDIYRNNTKIASVNRSFSPTFPEMNGNGFIDTGVTAGATYNYQVATVDTSGRTSPLSSATSVKQPAGGSGVTPTITIDSTATPQLASYMNNSLKPFIATWYPKITYYFQNGAYTSKFSSIKLVGDTTGTYDTYSLEGTTLTINVSASDHDTAEKQANFKWVSNALGAAALGTRFQTSPAWVTQGISYWPWQSMIRAEPMQPLSGLATYTKGYSAVVLLYDAIRNKYDPGFLPKLALAIHKQTYSPTLFLQTTGKTHEQLWNEATGRNDSQVAQLAYKDMCLRGYSLTGYYIDLQACSAKTEVAWRVLYDDSGSFRLGYDDLGCASGSNDDVLTADCSITLTNTLWKFGANKSIVHVESGKCMQARDKSSSKGNVIILAACDGSSDQAFSLKTASTAPKPLNVRATTGGSDVALIWDVPTDYPFVRAYNVYRDGVKIGTSQQNSYIGTQQLATAYYDASITRGRTYSYQVQALLSDGKVSSLSNVTSVTPPTTTKAVPSVTIDSSVAQLMPDELPYIQTIATNYLKTWYPKAVDKLVNGGFATPSTIVVKAIDKDEMVRRLGPNSANAYVDYKSNEMILNADFMKNIGMNSMLDTILHEMGHVVQYSDYNTAGTVQWVLEGGAEYVMGYMANYHPNILNTPASRTGNVEYPLAATNHYFARSYGYSAFLMDYITKNYDSSFISKMYKAINSGTTPASMMQMSNGKNTDQVYGDATGFGSRVGSIYSSYAARCAGSNPANAIDVSKASLQYVSCGSNIEQKIGVAPNSDGTAYLTLAGRCLGLGTVSSNNTTPVYMRNCTFVQSDTSSLSDNSKAERWTIRSDGTIVNQYANKCLEPNNASKVTGTYLQIYDCNGAAWQKWTTP